MLIIIRVSVRISHFAFGWKNSNNRLYHMSIRSPHAMGLENSHALPSPERHRRITCADWHSARFWPDSSVLRDLITWIVKINWYFLMHSWKAFQGESNDAVYKHYFEQNHSAMSENMKWRFWSTCWDLTYKGLTIKISGTALDREKRFDLICAIIKVFIFETKNAITWFWIIFMGYPSYFWAMFLWSPRSWAKVSEGNY